MYARITRNSISQQVSSWSYLATFMPWSASLNRFSRVQDVGPIVQTILVFLKGVAAFEMSGLQHKVSSAFVSQLVTEPELFQY